MAKVTIRFNAALKPQDASRRFPDIAFAVDPASLPSAPAKRYVPGTVPQNAFAINPGSSPK